MSFLSVFKSLLKALPGISGIVAQRDALMRNSGFVPPGHFLSPIVSIDEYLRDEATNRARAPSALLGIDLNTSAQLALLAELAPFWEAGQFEATPTAHSRYFCPNPAFDGSDAFFVQAMMRRFRPTRLIEVGSGYSSCSILDCNEHHLDTQLDLTFIEPYPQLLKSLVRPTDLERHAIIAERLQDVPLETFEALCENDILFIDSTHVSKTNSDVNYLFFEILPHLREGVIVHIHDIFYPFDYPKAWVLEGRSWNEAYMLRAFLQYNDRVEILLFNNYLQVEHAQAFAAALPELGPDGGGSIWLRIKARHLPQ
jgi:Methyltransferase domain